MDGVTGKTCTKCGAEKALDGFYTHNHLFGALPESAVYAGGQEWAH